MTNGEETVLLEELLPVPECKAFNAADYNLPAEQMPAPTDKPQSAPPPLGNARSSTPFANQEDCLLSALLKVMCHMSVLQFVSLEKGGTIWLPIRKQLFQPLHRRDLL